MFVGGSRWLVPALGGGPGCIFGHFSCRRLSVVRVFNAAKHGKSRKLPPDQPFPRRISGINGRFEPVKLLSQIWTPCGIVRAKGRLKNSEHNTSLVGGKITHKKRRRWTKFCSQQRPIRGRIRNKNTTINHINLFIHVLGACLCDSGWIGLLWLSWHHILFAGLFCDFGYRLIVMNCIFSYTNSPIKL